MFKLIRQYNQWILVVGGTLLMVAFLMPSAIQSCAQQSAVSGAPWATYGSGTELTGDDLDRVRRELGVVELLKSRGETRDPITVIGADKDPAHWWMLTHEAERAGLVGGPGEGEAAMASFAAAATAAGNPLTADEVALNIMRATGQNRTFVLETTAKWRGVMRLLSLSESVDRLSDTRIEQFLAKAMLGLSGDVIVIDAKTNEAIAKTELTESRLEEHLRAYADKAPSPSGGAEGFGYRLPDKIAVEWIAIPKDSVAALALNSPELQSLALKKRFAQDPAKYGADPATNPAYATYEATVRSKTIEELVQDKLDEITKFTSDQLALAQRSLKRRDSYLVLPENWSELMPSLDALAQSIATEFGIPQPMVSNSGPTLIGLDALNALPGVGPAMTSKFGEATRFQQLVTGARELSVPNPVAPIQARVASPALTDAAGNVYFFRITEAQASRPAKDLAEVRESVVKDVLALERFDWLKTNEAQIRDLAAGEGVRAVADKYGAKVEFVRDLREFDNQFLGFGFRLPAQIPGLGADPKALDALVAKAARLPLTADLSTIPAAERTFVALAPDRLALIVMQVTALSPASKETVESMRVKPASARVARDESMFVDITKVFGFDELARRTGFKQIRSSEEEGGEGEVAKDSGVAAGSTGATTPST